MPCLGSRLQPVPGWGALQKGNHPMSKPKLPPGMNLRGSVYWADFRVNSRRIRKRLSSNLKTAKQLVIELRARAKRGDFGLLDNDVPVEDLKRQNLQLKQLVAELSLEVYLLKETAIPGLEE